MNQLEKDDAVADVRRDSEGSYYTFKTSSRTLLTAKPYTNIDRNQN